jgi:hypothetical protein
VPSGVLIDIELKEKIATREDETIFFRFSPGTSILKTSGLVYHALIVYVFERLRFFQRSAKQEKKSTLKKC